MTASVDTTIEQDAAHVWRYVADPETFPQWLVGAQRVVSVDTAWPTAGSSFEHRIGVRPLVVPGSTTVVEVEPARRLVLRAGMGPLGEMQVTFELRDVAGGATAVRIVEEPTRGPVRFVGRIAPRLMSLALFGRNAASLEHLRALVQREAGGKARSTSSTAP